MNGTIVDVKGLCHELNTVLNVLELGNCSFVDVSLDISLKFYLVEAKKTCIGKYYLPV